MGIFDFMKSAGEKIFKPGEARKEAAIKRHLGGYGGDYAGIDVEVDGDTVVLTGRVPSHAAREKAVLIAGNVDGIDKVDDRLTVAAASVTVAATLSAEAASALAVVIVVTSARCTYTRSSATANLLTTLLKLL